MASAGGKAMEVVTVALGGGANHVGSHLWNLVMAEAEVEGSSGGAGGKGRGSQDFGVLLRERKGGERQPRVACFDLSGTVSTSYGSRSAKEEGVAETWSSDRVHNSLPDDSGDGSSQEPLKWDEYMYWGQQGSWRSELITCFPGTWIGVNAFDCYGDGIDLFSREDVRDTAFDKIRHLVEDCDYLQGFQILADDLSGFGHICSEVLLYVKDEVTDSRPLAVVGLRDAFAQNYAVQSNRSDAKRAALDCINRAWATCKISEASDIHVVLDQCWKPAPLYDASALGACLVDSLTLGCRLRGAQNVGSLRDIAMHLNPRGRRCALTSCAFGLRRPFGGGPKLELRSASSLCPTSCLHGQGAHSEYYVLRGVEKGGEGASGNEVVRTVEEARDWLISRWEDGDEAAEPARKVGLCPRMFVPDPRPLPLPFNFPTEGLFPGDPPPSVSSVVQFGTSDVAGRELAGLCRDFKRTCVKPGSPSVSSMLEAWELGREDCEEMAETLEMLRDEVSAGAHDDYSSEGEEQD